MKGRYWYAVIPFIVIGLNYYVSLMFEFIRMPSDSGVLIGLLMSSFLIFSILFTINKIKKNNEKSN